MSSRALRRAQATADTKPPSEEDSDSDAHVTAPSGKANSFAAFALLEGDDGSSEEENATDSADEETSVVTQQTTKAPVKSTKSQKKNAKRSAKSKCSAAPSDDDMDALLESLERAHAADTASCSFPRCDVDPLCDALRLDPAWLDANAELKKKFFSSGSGSVLDDINSRATNQHPALRKLAARKPFKRKHGFITPPPLWPPFAPRDTGLSVRRVRDSGDSGNGAAEYEIVEEDGYQHDLEDLHELVQAADFELLLLMVRSRPLFVDALLLLSDAYRMQSTGDAGEMVERAVYILERILPSELSFVEGRVRFRYAWAPNRKLHLALFRLVQYTIKKGCWRVALQLAKALLALDPETDPLGARLFVDFLALQAEALQDLDQLGEQLRVACPLGPLPGWLYSHALRMFLEEEQTKNAHSTSRDALMDAMLASPGTAQLMAEATKFRIPDGWHGKFKTEMDFVQSAASKIFVARASIIWKRSEIQQWFESAMRDVTARSIESVASVTPLNLSNAPVSCQVSVFRHSLLSDLPALNVAIPSHFTAISSLYAHDPLPAEDFEDEDDDTRPSILESLKNMLLGSFTRSS